MLTWERNDIEELDMMRYIAVFGDIRFSILDCGDRGGFVLIVQVLEGTPSSGGSRKCWTRKNEYKFERLSLATRKAEELVKELKKEA